MSFLASLLPKVAVFAVTTALSAVVATVAVAAVQNRTPQSAAGTAPAYLLTGEDTPGAGGAPAVPGVTVAFNEQASGQPSPLPTLAPADLNAAAASLLGGKPVSWTNPTGFPRITPISQFDLGPLQGFNCTMASGAMLARLGYGIVTTGSTLRSLQSDQEGGTGLNDVAAALWHGYGVTFPYGLIHPAQLKALLKAGYGAVVQGLYGDVPAGLRLQKDFTGGHAIYLDGYYPGNGNGIPEAYYVIDPLGRPWAGYEGDWWPASVVDQFMTAWAGGDRVAAMWAFPPGGTPPDVVGPDVLPIPPDNAGPNPTATPSPSGAVESGSPPPSGAPTPTPPIGPPQPGDNPVVVPANFNNVVQAAAGGIEFLPSFDFCLGLPAPPGCPSGIPATVTLNIPLALTLPPGPTIDVLFADSSTPNVAMVGFTVDPPATADVRFWQTGLSPAMIHTATAMSAFPLNGKIVTLARLDVLAGTSYQFQVVAGDGPSAAASAVGAFTSGPGVSQFDVSVGSASSPTFKLGTGLSPYLHPVDGAFAEPLVKMSALGSATCSESASIGGTSFCLEQILSLAPATCTKATVTYALSGVDATGVTVRAYPVGGGMALDSVIEVAGVAPSGTVDVGCLTSGLTYTIALDATGDANGVLASKTVTVP